MRNPATYRQNGRPPAAPPSFSVEQLLDEEERRRDLAKRLLAGQDVSQIAFFKLTSEIADRILDSKRAPGFKSHRWLRSVAAAKARRGAR